MPCILGLSSAYHNTAACLVVDGRIVGAIEEERLNRVKRSRAFPERSIKLLLEMAGLKPADIDLIAIAQLPLSALEERLTKYIKAPKKGYLEEFLAETAFRAFCWSASCIEQLMHLLHEWRHKPPILHIEHHEAHAASAYYCSGFNKCLVITADWQGDFVASTVYIGSNGELRRIAESPYESSWGLLYSYFTRLLGFEWLKDEGKVQALSAYGKPERFYPIMIHMMKSPNSLELPHLDSTIFPCSFLNKSGLSIVSHVAREPGLIRDYLFSAYTPEEISAALQLRLEEVVLEYVDLAIRATGLRNVALAGGLFLNIRVNKRIREELGVNCFVQPASGDMGTAIGAALRAYALRYSSRDLMRRLEHVYFGPSYSEDTILANLRRLGKSVHYKEVGDVAKEVADRIARGEVVGLFQGRMEFGPRALGNRSVLADPTRESIRERIDKSLKRREWFQPFGPTILDEYKEDYLERADESPFMIMAFDVSPERGEKVPATMHKDGTTRPQTLKKQVNPLFYDIIMQFYKGGGVPLVLNTSLNIHGEPIACSPHDALSILLRGGVDALIIGPYLVTRA